MKLLKYGSLKKVLFICVSFSFLCFSSYASNRTASSLGKGNWQVGVHLNNLLTSTMDFDPIIVLVAPGVAVTGGLSEKLDMTLSNTSVEFKYSFLNDKEGFSIAATGVLAFQLGIVNKMTVLSGGVGVGPMLSYNVKGFEPYILARYNYNYAFGSLDEMSVQDQGQSIAGHLGFNYWLNESTALNLNAGMNYLIGGGFLPVAIGLGLIWRI